ncbi:uncharacterized protein K452DRAFT_299123 [Aplosporella prunicola CBS 121167]|uniref:Mitochondrial outer membrane transport complex Sam37/metaxin N-terminal domain-containing protein n=1 Tax=Aplosporella prunicola CBS 121167 TaxID=1176127 RepID=A0A6A6BCY4_9PEZI|nr:uncharacterized protein K452DRAFT_299123 [Aplosporella prunicola CBS 121167]KAF2141074.1 hypothetical protein K452DRAFT_299123 [Aplosporella prunicola CBS 121167]
MVLELHVWGPAFGLPSIDAECIAAIAYAKQALRDGQWALVNAYDVDKSPTKEYPALRNGSTWIGGFHAIVLYLRRHSALERDLDEPLSNKERADVTAFSSFLRTTALPLLDLNLFVSSANYYNATSSAFTALLPWYLNYTIPPARRSAARARTQHLRLSALDLDSIADDEPDDDRLSQEKREAGIPGDRPIEKRASLLFGRRRRGLRSMLSAPEYAARFKLAALADACLGPLDELLGDKALLLRDDEDNTNTNNDDDSDHTNTNTKHTSAAPCSLDCLALGYLALMQYPVLPAPWLADTLLTRFPRLAAYTDRMRFLTIGAESPKPADLLALIDLRGSPEIVSKGRKELGLSLPWSPPAPPSLATAATSIAAALVARLPGLSAFASPDPVRPPKGKPPHHPPQRLLHGLAGAAATAAAALLAGAVYAHKHPGPEDVLFVNEAAAQRVEEASLADWDLGVADFSAGAMLAGLGAQMDFERQVVRDREMQARAEGEGHGQGHGHGRPAVEVRADVDVVEDEGRRPRGGVSVP